MSSTGAYTAPSAPGVYHVVAASRADASKADTAVVTVTAAVTSPPGTYPSATTLSKLTMPTLSEPGLYETKQFADLGTSVTRVANGPHHYAKDTPWNYDESLAKLNDGTILDGATFQPTGKRCSLGYGVWSKSAATPWLMYGFPSNQSYWQTCDARTGTVTRVKSFSGCGSGCLGGNEGGLSNDDRVAALLLGGVVTAIDPKTGTVLCTISGGSPDNAMPSQDGSYVVVGWSGNGSGRYQGEESFRVVSGGGACPFQAHVSNSSTHADTCVDQAGNQVLVGGLGSGIRMARLDTGEQTLLFSDTSQQNYYSCQNFRRPGWVYISSMCESVDAGKKIWNRGIAYKLDGSGTVENYAWLHASSSGCSYDAEPSMAVSPTGTRVWWKVLWDGGGGLYSFVARR